MILLNISYKGNDEVSTVLYGNGETFEDSSFLPYLYVIPERKEKPDMIIDGRSIVKIEEVKMKTLSEEVLVWKIYFKHPKDINLFRSELKEFGKRHEMDLPFTRRYMIDKGLTTLQEISLPSVTPTGKFHEPKVLAFDIETLSSNGIEIGKNPIIMISLWGEGLKKVIGWGDKITSDAIIVKDEKEMIKKFIELVDEYSPDIITGYNTDGFDFPYLIERAKKMKTPFLLKGKRVSAKRRGRETAYSTKGLIHIDLYQFIRNILSPYMQSETLGLDVVASELVGEGKVKIGGAKGIENAWEKNPELLYKYSLQDSKVTYLLSKEILPMMIKLSQTVGQTLFDVSRMTPGQIVEWLLIKEAHNQKILVPNRPKYLESQERRAIKYTGAFVKEPIKGLHSPIAVCDFRSLYPTIIMAHNISPDTVNCTHKECRKNVSPTNIHFCTKKVGFITKVLTGVFNERMKLKKKAKTLPRGSHERKIVNTHQKALKLILNSVYGYLGYSNARWYTLESASSITSWGRDYITKIMKEASESGFTVVYGDTDSVMLTSPSKTFEEDVKSFLKDVNSKLPSPMELELEDLFVRGVFVTKKRYALLSKEGRLVVKGLEKVRRDWSPLSRDTQEKVLRLILKNKVDDAKKYVQSVVKKLRAKEINISELIIKTQLTKRIKDYKQIAPHVKVAKDLVAMGKKVHSGMLIEYVVTPGRRSISERSVPAQMAKDYDADYYVENQILPAVTRIFEALGASKQELEMKQRGLSSFF